MTKRDFSKKYKNEKRERRKREICIVSCFVLNVNKEPSGIRDFV